jgi:hypothetical protein
MAPRSRRPSAQPHRRSGRIRRTGSDQIADLVSVTGTRGTSYRHELQNRLVEPLDLDDLYYRTHLSTLVEQGVVPAPAAAA